MKQYSLSIQSRGRGTVEFSSEINQFIHESGISHGLCHVFLHHTSASLIITENADSDVRRDLENYFSKLVLDADPAYFHDQEGADDMSAHIRSVLTQSEITIPIRKGYLALGTWQGLYLWEHRTSPHRRNLTITLQGNF